MTLVRFEGNCPRNVAKYAKYAVRTYNERLVVGLVYETQDGERWYVTNEAHPELVEMVSSVKLELSGHPGGAFYINEYHQVIVPGTGTEEYFLAGEYTRPLRFEFEGHVLSGEPVRDDGTPLEPGEEWHGPRPGIPYVIRADGRDIYYKLRPRPNVERRIFLSRHVGQEAAASIARRLLAYKGWGGGRFYVNEWRAMFAPVGADPSITAVYLGRLGPTDPWFPKPNVSDSE
jgi:hypothetical protein